MTLLQLKLANRKVRKRTFGHKRLIRKLAAQAYQEAIEETQKARYSLVRTSSIFKMYLNMSRSNGDYHEKMLEASDENTKAWHLCNAKSKVQNKKMEAFWKIVNQTSPL